MHVRSGVCERHLAISVYTLAVSSKHGRTCKHTSFAKATQTACNSTRLSCETAWSRKEEPCLQTLDRLVLVSHAQEKVMSTSKALQEEEEEDIYKLWPARIASVSSPMKL